MAEQDVLDYDEEQMEEEMREMNKEAEGAEGPQIELIEFFWKTDGTMQCPVEECGDLKFSHRAKYYCHWQVKHLAAVITYVCSVVGCSATAKRKSDMKCHLSRIHHLKDKNGVFSLTSKLNACTRKVTENKGFINPGFLTYKNRIPPTSSTSQASLTTTTTSSSDNFSTESTSSAPSAMDTSPVMSASSATSSGSPSSSSVSTVTSSVPLSSGSSRKSVSLQQYKQMNRPSPPPSSSSASSLVSSFGISANPVVEVGTQTVLTDCKPFGECLPPIPDTETELENFLVYLCNALDSLGRTRQAAKERLEEIRRDGDKLERARKERRKLEAENRSLKKELAEMKDFNKLLSDLHM